ncbi:MAG: hypothetical protein WBW41_03245 [Verrucomicrobiia bacterium]
MEQHVDEMMRPGFKAEQLTNGHVRNPRERNPVARLAGSESPTDPTPGQATLDDRVFADVIIVVENTETVLARRQIDRASDERQQQCD